MPSPQDSSVLWIDVMIPSRVLLLLVFTSLATVDANPPNRSASKATLSFSMRVDTNGTFSIAEMDRARAQAFRNASKPSKHTTFADVTNSAVVYSALVGIGSPATNFTLLIDSGSSNTWVNASEYVPTSASNDTGNSVSVTYDAGSFSGEEWTDTVTLASGFVIENQSIGVASSATGFSGYDGILGLGPVDLTSGTVSNTGLVPTVMDNLFSQGVISEEVLGIYYVPVSEPNSVGSLTFGGYDDSVITGPMEYVPLTTTPPSSTYWGINMSISYGGTTIMSSNAGIVDIGTTLIVLPSDTFQDYQSATGSTFDPATGFFALDASQYANLQTLSFNIGGRSYNLTPNAQIWPRSLNHNIGGNSSAIYLVVTDSGNPSGSGSDFIVGYTFLERYYSVLDTTNGQVGFATTAYTHATTN